VNEERQLALLTGDKTYTGKRCKACGCTTRYAKSGSCTGCTQEKAEQLREIERLAKKRKRRRPAPADDAEMNELLGLNANSSMIEKARTLPSISPDTATPVEDTSEIDHCTPCTPRIVHGGGSNGPIGSEDSTGAIHRVEIGKSGEGRVQSPDSAAEPMASSVHDFVSPELVKTRYWCHPESGCVWTTIGTDDAHTDGLVEEISAEAYADLVTAGFTESVNPVDDLDDIL
jgi:hypothetical protein